MNRKATAVELNEPNRAAALCLDILTTKLVFAPGNPEVTAAGLNVYAVPGGKPDALIVTVFVNEPFIESTTMTNVADASGGISCLPYWKRQ
jgi:hypothetical protein